MNMQQNANPTVATGRDVADNIMICRALDALVSGSISMADLRSQLATSLASSFPSDPREQFDVLSTIICRFPFELFQCVIESTPVSPAAISEILYVACMNVNLRLVKYIIETHPACFEHEDKSGNGESFPSLFLILFSKQIHDRVVLTVLKLLLERHPEIVRNARTSKGNSLLHWAASTTTMPMRAIDISRSIITAFQQLVLEYSEDGYLPLHHACISGNSEIVTVMLEKRPDAINCMTRDGMSPLHTAAATLAKTPQAALDVMRYLLKVAPSMASVRDSNGKYPLSYACLNTTASNLNIGVKAISLVYDAYPRALVNKEELFRRLIASDHYADAVRNFLTEQLRYVEQASDVDFLRTPDENGRIPLHNAICDFAMLGSIKLFVEANPSALQHRDNSGSLPVHTACKYDVCLMYLLDFDSRSLFDQDNEGNTPLHFACLYANYELIIMLFAKYQNLPVKSRNSDDDLPIHLLVDNRDQDVDNTGYLSCLFLLLKADPDLLLSVDEM